MEEAFFPLALKTGKPLLGICRGIQLMNALLGGSLWQDLPKEFPSEVNHHETPPYDKVAHPVSIRPGNPLYDAVGVTEMGVNSYHHQAVKTLGRGASDRGHRPPTGWWRRCTCRGTGSAWGCSGTRSFPA